MGKLSAKGSTSLGFRTLTTAGLVAVVAAVVLGILGMHGLSQHGSMNHGSLPGAAASVDPHAGHPAPDHTPVATDASVMTSAAGFAASSGHHESAGDMVMVCVAMLLAAAVGVLLTLAHRWLGHRTPLSLMPLIRMPAFPATARAGTGPPPVWEFSVVRC